MSAPAETITAFIQAIKKKRVKIRTHFGYSLVVDDTDVLDLMKSAYEQGQLDWQRGKR